VFKQAKLKQKQFKDVFGTEVGKLVLRHLYNDFSVGRCGVTSDARFDAYREGMRAAYVHIVKTMSKTIEEDLAKTEEVL